jgi:hypothetical protein
MIYEKNASGALRRRTADSCSKIRLGTAEQTGANAHHGHNRGCGRHLCGIRNQAGFHARGRGLNAREHRAWSGLKRGTGRGAGAAARAHRALMFAVAPAAGGQLRIFVRYEGYADQWKAGQRKMDQRQQRNGQEPARAFHLSSYDTLNPQEGLATIRIPQEFHAPRTRHETIMPSTMTSMECRREFALWQARQVLAAFAANNLSGLLALRPSTGRNPTQPRRAAPVEPRPAEAGSRL